MYFDKLVTASIIIFITISSALPSAATTTQHHHEQQQGQDKHQHKEQHNHLRDRKLQGGGPGGPGGPGVCNGNPLGGNQPNDLGIRFSKVQWTDDTTSADVSPGFLPLDENNFPIGTGRVYKTLKDHSLCPSVINSNDLELRGMCMKDFINEVGGIPEYPSSDANSPYWKELKHVALVQKARKTNVNTIDLMPLPDIWRNFNLDQVADAVHDEYPGIWHIQLIQQLLSEGASIDTNIIPWRSEVDFLRGPVALSDLNTWSISNVGPTNFYAKYHVGMPRPEEMAHLINQDDPRVIGNTPNEVKQAIDDVGMDGTATSFTAYSEGSPQHPSWPAMHSAASSSALWLAVVMNLTEEQWCQVKLVDYGVAYARTVAGVHYQMDNVAGLNMGQAVIAEKLEDHLVEKYGASRPDVRKKIGDKRTDWSIFDIWTCDPARTGPSPTFVL
mmetsp:Transcript_35287/g.54182  ORF Transcript_35287/g.54182 Transcript_35287/m.54182 type:complete len:443 (+) Transcript_35287:91-1419(+)